MRMNCLARENYNFKKPFFDLDFVGPGLGGRGIKTREILIMARKTTIPLLVGIQRL